MPGIQNWTSHDCSSGTHYAANRYPCGNCGASPTSVNITPSNMLCEVGKWYADDSGTYMYEVTGSGSSGGSIVALAGPYNQCANVLCAN